MDTTNRQNIHCIIVVVHCETVMTGAAQGLLTQTVSGLTCNWYY